MKNKTVLGIDVDGCLANFNEAFRAVQIRTSKRDLFPAKWADDQITCWNWPTDQYGYTKEEYKSAWEQVWASDKFWAQLTPYPDTIRFFKSIRPISDDIYFITQRAGRSVKRQTENWLKRYGAGEIPTVLISGDKAGCCEALGITHYIDDKDENCLDVQSKSGANVTMLARGWNHEQIGIPRIDKLEEWVEEVRNGQAN